MSDFINQFPYSDFHEMNLDWIIKTCKNLADEMAGFEAANTVTYQGYWDITKQYTKWSIVTYGNYSYMSVQEVPVGVSIDNRDYWVFISDYSIDQELDDESVNAVENRVITAKFASTDEHLETLDTTTETLTTGLADEITARGNADDALSARITTNTTNIGTNTSGLAAEIASRAEADSALSSRIDNIATLSEGSTTGDAELADIRVGLDGKTWPSAGAAVRGQIQDTEDYIQALDKFENNSGLLITNLFDKTGATDGKYLRIANGTEATQAEYFYTDYFPVNEKLTYYITGTTLGTTGTCCYDQDKRFIQGFTVTTGDPLIIPANTFYVRMNFKIDDKDSLGFYTVNSNLRAAQGKSYLMEQLKTGMIMQPTPVNTNNYTGILSDLNDANDDMIYLLLFSGYAITGIPDNIPYDIYLEPGILFTVTAQTYKKQYYMTNTGIFTRIYGGGVWQSWTVIQKPTMDVPNAKALIQLVESGIPCNINLKANVELWSGYKSAHGDDYWTNYQGYSVTNDRNDAGLYLHPHVNFNGNGHVVSFTPDTDYTPVQRDFSPFNLGGDNIIENVVINIGQRHCRYALHDDFALTTEGEIIRNITMIGTGVSPALLGAGVKPYCNYIVENCLFLDNAGAVDIRYHATTQDVQAASYLVIRNNYCQKAIQLEYVGTNQVHTPCIVTGNKASAITVAPGSGSHDYENMDLYAWNNDLT